MNPVRETASKLQGTEYANTCLRLVLTSRVRQLPGKR